MYFLLIKSLESDIVKSVLAASLLCSFLALIFRKRQSFQANKYSVEIFLDLPHFQDTIKGLTGNCQLQNCFLAVINHNFSEDFENSVTNDLSEFRISIILGST